MNSTTSYQFDVDDISLGDAFAVLSQGGRRLLLQNLRGPEIETLKFLSKHRRFERGQISDAMFASLHGKGLILDASQAPRAGGASLGAKLTIPSALVTRLARPLSPLFSPAGLALIALGHLLAFQLLGVRLARAQDFAHWATSVTALDAAATLCIILLSMVIHEFGHATACLRMTGATGAIKVKAYRGTPAMAADVSSICMTDERGKAIVALAGAIFQGSYGVVLLAFGPDWMRMGATMAVLGAMFSMTPLPNTDGYWMLRDFFNLRLNPKLWPRAGLVWTDIVYGYALLGATAGFGYILFRQCAFLYHRIAASPAMLTLENVAVGALLVYLTIVSFIFIWKNSKLLRSDAEET